MMKQIRFFLFFALTAAFFQVQYVQAQSRTVKIPLDSIGEPAGIRGSDEGQGGDDTPPPRNPARAAMAYDDCVAKTELFLSGWEIRNNEQILDWRYSVADPRPRYNFNIGWWVYWAFEVEASLRD